ncbi:MAG: DUF6152 family protein [Candidatus Rariloculaceae bacterium]
MRKLPLVLMAALLLVGVAKAHHSFAPYDIRQKVEFSGVVESWRFARPHPILMIREDGEDGRTWKLEVATRQWERQEIPKDAIESGDALDVVIWPARDGSAEGVLSAFTNDGVYALIHDEVRQRSANEAAEASSN